MTVEEAGRAFGLSRTVAYEQARLYFRTDGAEGIPSLRFGKRIVCPTAAVRKKLGLDDG